MALSPEDVDTLSRLLDAALELEPARREAWIAALPPHERALAEPLRAMLASEDTLDADQRFAELPRMTQDEAVAERGEAVGPYRLRHEIGRGGMGSVWLAERSDGSFKRQVALKLPRLAWGAGLAERMAREREIGALLEHPAIARMYDAGVDERGRPYLAFEYIDGQPIDAWCESQTLGVRQRLALFVQVVKAVAYAHGRLVVHRDLKPSNVLVTPDGQAHLLDFGIAKLLQDASPGSTHLTHEQGRVFTPHYASPEQIAGEPVTVASDVYSLGVLLYELLTGELPLAPRRETLGAIEDAILEGHTRPASTRVKDKATARALRGEIDAILAKAMQREPERRYGTAEALALDIERHLQGETVSARPDSLGYRLHKGIQRHWVAVSTISAVLIAVVSGSAVAVMQAQKAARSAEREQVVREFVADVFRVNSRVNPINAALRPATPLSLLEGGAQLIQQRFKGQPDMQAELFGVVGGVFSDMGAYKLAAEYATRRIEALDLVGTDKAEQSKALLALAQALFDDGKFADAELRARKAEELATTDAPVLLDAVVLRVRLELALGKFDAARSSLLLLERLASSTAAPTAAKAWALSFRARLLGEDSRLDEAISSFEKAIDTALHAEGPLSTTAITIRRTLAAVLIQNGNLIAGRRQYDAALAALHQLGGAHEVQAIYVSAQAAHDQNAGWALSVDEAVSEMRRCRRLLELSPMPVPKWYLAQLDFWIGEIQGLSGNVSSALPLLESSGDVLRKEFTSMSSLRRIAKLTGLVMGKAGRHDAANRLLRQALDLRLASGRKNHPTLAFDYALLSQNFTMAGDYAEAERTLAEAPRFEPLQGSPTGGSEFNQIVEWARASIQIAQGNAKAALKLLRDNEPTTQEAALLSVYRATLGEALCADHQPVQGLAAMRQAIHELEAGGEHPDSPDLARSRSIAGLCALAAGNLNLASAYAAKARSAFTAQPGVSPYYKKPSEALDRKMGVRTGALKTS